MKVDIELLLFDLGGVIVELGPSPLPTAWLTESGQQQSWFGHSFAEQFERGELDEEEFATRVRDALQLKASTAEILGHFRNWPIGLFPGANDLLAELGRRHRVAALTNTNSLHWPRLLDEFHLGQHFEQIFASHLLGMMKPDPAIFEHVFAALELIPEQILFLDDNAGNIAAAGALGCQCLHVQHHDNIRPKLTALGLLDQA